MSCRSRWFSVVRGLVVVVLFGTAASRAQNDMVVSAPAPLPDQIVIRDRAADWQIQLGQPGAGESDEGRIAWQSTLRRGAAGDVAVVINLRNSGDARRCIVVEYQFRLDGTDFSPYLPGPYAMPAWPDRGELAYAYVREDMTWIRLSVPYAGLFDAARDRGCAFAPELNNQPIATFEVQMRRDGGATHVVIRRPAVRLEPGGRNRIVLHVANIGGDWREGLAWMRDKWSNLFMVPAGMDKYQQCTWTGTSYYEGAYERTISHNPLKRGVCQTRPRPWFGLNIADFEPWLISVDQKWHYLRQMKDLPGLPGDDATVAQIRKFVESLEPDEALVARLRAKSEAFQAWRWLRLTHDKVRKHWDRLIADGFTWHYYWNASETWRYWSSENYPDSLFVPLSQDFWKDSTVLDPYVGSKRAADLVGDARRIFDTYPKCSGLFLDQVYFDLDNTKDDVDDGVSVTPQGKPFSRMQWNTWRVLKEVRRIADARGKVLHANFIFNSLEIASLTDFGVVEGISPMENMSWFYDIGNRMHICLTHDERTNQQCVIRGWQNNLWVLPDGDRNDRGARWWMVRLMLPMMMMLQERSVVLEPHCLELPDGFEGNVFRRPDGNVLVPIITHSVSHRSPYEWTDLDVTVRISDAAEIKRVYQLSSDRLGPLALDFERRGNELHISVTRHRSISMLVLGAAGRFAALTDDVLPPGASTVTIVRDDLDKDTRTTEQIPVPGTGRDGEFVFVELPGDGRTLLPDPANDLKGQAGFELRVTPALEVTLAPAPAMVQRVHAPYGRVLLPGKLVWPAARPAVVRAAVHNHTDRARDVTLAVKADLLSATPASPQVTVPPGARAVIDLTVVGRAPGAGSLAVSAGETPEAATAAIAIEIVGTSLDGVDLTHVKSAALIVDSVADGNPGQAIYVNGVRAGTLTQRGGTPVWDFRARHDLSAESLTAFEAANTVEIDTGDKKFVVARPELEVVLDDGRRYILQSDGSTQSTPSNWRQAAGERIEANGRMSWTFR